MFRTMLKSKIHRATVTQADLHYVGSVTIDEDLMDAADLWAGEQVAIVDITNGARLETYAISGPRGSGVIGINGAAARLVHVGDLVILISYGVMEEAEAKSRRPRVIFVDAENRNVGASTDPADALPSSEEALAVATGGDDWNGRLVSGLNGDMSSKPAGSGAQVNAVNADLRDNLVRGDVVHEPRQQ